MTHTQPCYTVNPLSLPTASLDNYVHSVYFFPHPTTCLVHHIQADRQHARRQEHALLFSKQHMFCCPGRNQHVQGSPSSQHSSRAHAASVHHPNQATSHQTQSAMSGSGSSNHWPMSVELQELFAVLKSWLSLAGSRHGLPLWQE